MYTQTVKSAHCKGVLPHIWQSQGTSPLWDTAHTKLRLLIQECIRGSDKGKAPFRYGN